MLVYYSSTIDFSALRSIIDVRVCKIPIAQRKMPNLGRSILNETNPYTKGERFASRRVEKRCWRGNSSFEEEKGTLESALFTYVFVARPNLATYLRIWRNGVQIMRVANPSLPLDQRASFYTAGIFYAPSPCKCMEDVYALNRVTRDRARIFGKIFRNKRVKLCLFE